MIYTNVKKSPLQEKPALESYVPTKDDNAEYTQDGIFLVTKKVREITDEERRYILYSASAKKVREIIDGKSGIVRIPNSKNYYRNGALVKIEFKNIFEKICYYFNG